MLPLCFLVIDGRRSVQVLLVHKVMRGAGLLPHAMFTLGLLL